MNTLQIRVLFDRKGQATSTRPALIQLEVRYAKQRKFIGTGIKVCKGQFKNGRVVARTDADTLNDRINALCRHINETYTSSLNNRTPFTLAMLTADNVTASATPFLDFVRRRTEEKRCAASTRRQNRLFADILTLFGGIKTFDDITLPAIHLFDDWLKTHQGIHTRRPLTDNTVKAYHSRLRAFISEAVSFGLLPSNPYAQFKFGRCHSIPRMYLTAEELDILHAYTPPTRARRVALHLFLVQCYTGLSYSDLMATDFTAAEEHEGNLILPRTTRIKTGTQYYIMLLPPVINILRQYDYRLPHMFLSGYTRQLALIERETAIGKHLTSHVGRHTFATTIALGAGIPIEVVSKMLGHTNIQTTQIYAKIRPQQVMQGFAAIRSNITKKREGD